MSRAEEALNRDILAAHERGDGDALVMHYTAAADLAEKDGDAGRCAFFLTQAWVFALEGGQGEAESLASRLRRAGRLD